MKKAGRLPKGVRLKSITIEPGKVKVEGSESSLTPLSQLYTEPVDLGAVTRSQILELKLLPPSPQVRLNSDEFVRASIVITK